jgi:hypothetical protein
MSATTLAITARLLADARAAVTRDGHWLLTLELAPPAGPRGKPRLYVAVRDYGTGEAAAIACKSRARELTFGALVRVHAAGEDEARGRSVLAGVDHIEALAQPAHRNHHHEPREAADA